MSQQFQCTIDEDGNIAMRSGWVICPRAGTKFEVADLAISTAEFSGNRGFRSSMKAMFLGGSGANLSIVNPPSTVVPCGIFKPGAMTDTWEGTFADGITITLGFDGGATISDGMNVIADAPAASFTTAPVGDFASTPYGETNYNGGDPFTLTVAWEGGFLGTGFPMAGDVWVEVTETSPGSGVAASVSGGKFGPAMPEPSGSIVPVLIADSDGLGGLNQYQEGPIIWGDRVAPIVQIGLADFTALSPPDSGTLYAVTGP